jgi:murein DD-endopeptidase MepM/ murein hydrolase activator NlpD
VRRLVAKSRIGAIISAKLQNSRVELLLGVVAAVLVLALWGSSAEGQSSLLDTWVRQYVEEKALAFDIIPRQASGIQLADNNTLFAVGSGGDSADHTPAPSLEAATVNGSALIAMAPPDSAYIDQLTTRRSGVSEYTVQEGDLLSFIASDFGVSTQSILWANSLKDADSISPGQILRIPPVSGVIHKAGSNDSAASLAKKYGVAEDRIIAYNHLPKDGSVLPGTEIIVPDGHPASVPMTPKATTASIDSKIKRVGTYTAAGSALTALKFNYLPDLGDYFKIPTFGFNWGILHDRNGVDIANSCGTPIYAAADGVVSFAVASGWNGGFGKYIKISHSNGTETLYGHLSKILISSGQAIGRGDKIGLMGTTGQSTGCHLHFEVHGARNPLAKY